MIETAAAPERVVVIGAGGFVGSTIVAAAEQRGYAVQPLGSADFDLLADGAGQRLLDRLQPNVLEASSPWRGAWIAASWRGAAVRALFMHHDPLSAFAYRWFDAMAPRAVRRWPMCPSPPCARR